MLFFRDTSDLSRKERERLFKKSEILNSALKLFATHGFSETTLDDIAVAAEFGKGTIYNYFKNKEEIYSEIIETIHNYYMDLLNQIDSETNNFNEFITKLTKSLFRFYYENEHAILLLARFRVNTTESNIFQNSEDYNKIQSCVNEIFTQRLTKAIELGEIRDVPIEAFMGIFKSMIFMYIYNKLHCCEGMELNIEEESEFLLSIIFNGILNKQGDVN